MSDLLDDDELAYIRETRAETRPTEAALERRTQAPTGSGGRANTYAEAVTIGMRVDDREETVPAAVTAVLGGAKAVKLTLDRVEVRSGDRITADGYTYEVVTDNVREEWESAAVVWAKVVRSPARA